MGQSLAALAGRPVVDVTPPVSPSRAPPHTSPPPPLVPRDVKKNLSIHGLLCPVCLELPVPHVICCMNGHGGCLACMQREQARSGHCPTCRMHMCPRLIPNLTLDAAVAATQEAAPSHAPPPRARLVAKRTALPDPQARQRKLARLASSAQALSASPLEASDLLMSE